MAEDAAPMNRRALDGLVGSYAAERHCPTISWGIVRDGDLMLSGAVGDVDERTVYRIASMTKSFSAAATLLLRDEGTLRLDDALGLHAPELAALRSPTDDAATMTIRDLLSMTSGLVADDAWADRHLDLTDDEFDRIVADGCVFADTTGTTYEYSNFGFAALGRVVHRATGRRIQDVVSDRLLAPLSMTATMWEHPEHLDWVRPTRWLDGRFVDERAPLGDGLIAPMGGIWSCVSDLARWVAWLDDAFPARNGDDEGPLARGSRREMQSPQSYVGLRSLRGQRIPTSYGYGLRILHEPALGRVVTHSGGFPGYGSNMRWLPGRRLGVIALSNVTYAPMTELTARMLDLLHTGGLVPAEPAAPATTADELERTGRRLIALFNDWTDSAADEVFADNVALDDDYGRRRAALADDRPLTVTTIRPINWARARIECTAASGAALTVTYALAPAEPPRIQQYEIER